MYDLSLITQENVSDLVSPYAICASTKDEFQLFVSDVRLSKIFSICNVVGEESQYVGEIKELLSFERSSLLTSIALSRDEQHLLVGDGSGSNVHVCQVRERLRLRTMSDIPSPTGIAVTDCGTVFLSSSKENALFRNASRNRNPNKSEWRYCGSLRWCEKQVEYAVLFVCIPKHCFYM